MRGGVLNSTPILRRRRPNRPTRDLVTTLNPTQPHNHAASPQSNVVGSRRRTRVAGDEIFLTSFNPLEKFAVSCSLAQSAKLFVFERRLEFTIDRWI